MDYQNLSIQEDNGIVIVIINREKALNALNQQTMAELKDLFENNLPQRSDIKGVILTGAGEKAFVAGADIKEFLDLDENKGAEMSRYGQQVFLNIEEFPKPVIAAVNGFALGGGCELAMACHIRIASEKAKFGQPEVNLGIIPGYGGTQRLTKYVGKSKAMELMLTGDMIDANEAYRLQLVNYVVPAGEEVTKAKELIEKIATKAPIAIAKVISCVNRCCSDVGDGYAFEVIQFGHTTGTEDFKEGAAAFIERRKANFKGE